MHELTQYGLSAWFAVWAFVISHQWNNQAHENPNVGYAEYSRRLVMAELLFSAIVFVVASDIIDVATVYLSNLK